MRQLAAILKGPEDIVTEMIEEPELQSDEILVRVEVAGICGSDVHWFRGHDPWRLLSYPTRLGHEIAGTVEAHGRNTAGFTTDDRVAVRPGFLRSCGACDKCRVHQTQLCRRQGQQPHRRPAAAGLSQFIAVQPEDLYLIPPGLSFEAAALADVYACALHAVRSTVRPGMRELLIIGTGPLALAMAAVAPLFGLQRRIMLGRSERALMLARASGYVGETIDTGREDPAKKLDELCGGRAADAVVETVGGDGDTAQLALSLVDAGGTVCLSGAFWRPLSIDYRDLSARELTVIAPNAHGSDGEVPEMENALGMMASGVIDAPRTITHRFALPSIRQAFVASAARSAAGAMKVVVVP